MKVQGGCAGGLLALLFALLLAASAWAHTPERLETLAAGPYSVILGVPAGAVPAGQEIPIDVIAPPNATSWELWAVPDPGTDAVPVRARVADAALGETRIVLPVAGPWHLQVRIDGPSGPGEASWPLAAKAPPKIPVWAAWCIALLPLAGFALFCVREGRRALRLAAGSPPRG